MQLRLQRSQRAGGLTGATIFFCLDVRADYSPDERSNINRYKLGGQTIYNSRAALKHLESSGAQLERTQEGSAGNRLVGLARGAASLALAKMHLNITIASLGRGHHVECKDLEELLETEDTLRNASKNLTKYLEIAATFDGSEVVIEYDKGEEQVHITPHAPALLEAPSTPVTEAAAKFQDADYEEMAYEGVPSAPVPADRFTEFVNSPRFARYMALGIGAIILLLLLHSCA